MPKYCLCCGKRYDMKPMCPDCVKFRNVIVEKCAIVAEKSGFRVADANRTIAEMIRELKVDDGTMNVVGPRRTSVKTGARFGMLRVGKPLRKNEHSQVLWEVICDCGRKGYAWGYNLVKGKKTSCGCVRAGLSR